MSESEVITFLEDLANEYEPSNVSVFFANRTRLSAGKYQATIIIRTIPDMQKASRLTKRLMEEFINGRDIVFERSVMGFVEEKGLRVEDFEVSCEFDI
ncbi:TPA: hypothetical protein RPW15_001677 [Campylobacter fetus subsp. venerealis]|uniref:Uncharacterized protein n=1 Tax=Campylobacter fetus subsp. venerealis NCTC 10354 TaxID=983328 RepID=A0AAE6M9N5_CAMFE|nr:hypothetical protein [Campylobacter fetus]OCS25438.1 hypothetical protein CFVB10_08555 [Campylobacter fetus subsp. venerealis cfvB10]OCS29085.1 hypothetical protein CFVCCUG33900_08265 [Campylobacter fetus subsp. venerealis LMG 6570 = CCUG 33900]AIR80144.1 hypothetical protein CFV97608_0481 [Campylobacter fetus subsp. venerealis 97/608]EAK0836137.1 hypothetical protein [Campylobacter fetus]MBK3487500.1 hypothetical protein [Campylobacter fetus subsp. venerealis]